MNLLGMFGGQTKEERAQLDAAFTEAARRARQYCDDTATATLQLESVVIELRRVAGALERIADRVEAETRND